MYVILDRHFVQASSIPGPSYGANEDTPAEEAYQSYNKFPPSYSASEDGYGGDGYGGDGYGGDGYGGDGYGGDEGSNYDGQDAPGSVQRSN